MKVDHVLTPHTKINSKCIKDLNIRPETIKFLKENIDSKILEIARSYIFSNVSSQARETKEKNKQMGLHQTKNFLHGEGNHQQIKETMQ